jgi:hypothetical protein
VPIIAGIVAVAVLALLAPMTIMLNRLELFSFELLVVSGVIVWNRFAGRTSAATTPNRTPVSEIAFSDPTE